MIASSTQPLFCFKSTFCWNILSDLLLDCQPKTSQRTGINRSTNDTSNFLPEYAIARVSRGKWGAINTKSTRGCEGTENCVSSPFNCCCSRSVIHDQQVIRLKSVSQSATSFTLIPRLLMLVLLPPVLPHVLLPALQHCFHCCYLEP